MNGGMNMGKSRKKLAVLLAAAMTLSMTFGMTAFAADDTVPGEPVPAVEAADTEPGIPEPVTVTEPDPDVPTDTTVTEPVPMDTTLTEPVPAGTTPTGSVPAADDPAGPETTSTNDIPDVPSAPDNTVPLNDDAETPDNDTDGSTLPPEGDIPNDGGQTEGGLVAEVTEVEEEPTEVSIAGSENLTQSDSFVSLGEGKGSYQYDGETLILKDAQIEVDPGLGWTGGINIYGDLIIILEGDNAIIVGANSEGIYIYNGDLTIKGDGTLTISNKAGEYNAEEYYYEGIYNAEGNITIDGADVNIDVYSNELYDNSGIYAYGDINIINGANVTAKSTAMGDGDVTHYGILADQGKISIIDSNVTASADGRISLEDGILQMGIGLLSRDSRSLYDLDADCLAGIVIDNSNVRSIGSFASMLVVGRDGTITIDGSTIVSPEGVNVRDLIAVIGDDPDAAASVIGAILATGEGPIDLDAIMEKINDLIDAGDEDALLAYLESLFGSIAKDVNIIRNSELYAEKAGIPVTGDSYHAELLILGLIAAGTVSIYLIRRRMTA